MAQRFRKKPVVVEAMSWEGTDLGLPPAIYRFTGESNVEMRQGELWLWNKPEGCWVRCPDGHWIIKGVSGEVYPIANDIFEATYEPVDP